MAGIDRRLDTSMQRPPQAVRDAAKKAEQLINTRRVRPEDFRGRVGFDEGQIDAHLAQVANLRTKFKTPDEEFAKILEAILALETADLFGAGTRSMVASEYDDYVNGVDMALIVQDKDKQVIFALAVDATLGESTAGQKIKRILDAIERSEGATIEYFKSGARAEKLTDLPRAVIGLDQSSVRELAALWKRDELHTLSRHPLRRIIVEEIASQTQAYARLATQLGKQNMAEVYERASRTLAVLERSVKGIPYKTPEFDAESDPVFSYMQMVIKNIAPQQRRILRSEP